MSRYQYQNMDMARRALVDNLFAPRRYRPGKTSAIGWAHGKRQTLVELAGPGVFRRLWTTHGNDSARMMLYFFVDGVETLSGPAQELAEAAEKVQCPAAPLGGYVDGKSVNIYLPLVFEKNLRIEAEPQGDPGDGPYWQIDYSLGAPEERLPLPGQELKDGKIHITCAFPALEQSPARPLQTVEKTLGLAGGIGPANIRLDGGGIIRRLEVESKTLDSLLLRIAFDSRHGPEARAEDGPFQVEAPLRYLVWNFDNACVSRHGDKAEIFFPMPFRSCADIQFMAGVEYGAFGEKHEARVRVEYENLPEEMDEAYFFHARFVSGMTEGDNDFECLSVRGKGHFVGVHIFDTGHDHGGGDNIFFDGRAATAGQLHGICGEDYFHMAYMAIGNRTPFSGCPSHAARWRYHLEMPIPFEESFVFNWGSFAGQPAKAVAFWYQDAPAAGPTSDSEPVYVITGPFPLNQLDNLSPDRLLPSEALVWAWGDGIRRPVQSWRKRAQQGFLDLCHVYRHYIWRYPPATGCLLGDVCVCAETAMWAAREAEATLRVGCDEAIRVWLNGENVFSDNGRNMPDPFKVFSVPVKLKAGLNTIRVAVANTANHNWYWYGFSLAVDSELGADEFRYML